MTGSQQDRDDQETQETHSSAEAVLLTEEEADQTAAEGTDPYAALSVAELRAALTQADAQRHDLEKAVEDAEARAAAAQTEIQRMAADFQNARKRLDRLSQEQVAHAKEGMVTKLLAVLDDLDLAEANAPADLNSAHDTWFKGVTQIREKILTVFQDEDVTLVDTSGAFDPNQHEAVQAIPSAEHDKGHIVETLRKGYRRGEKVIRPAMVRIAA